ncbi:MAG: PEP-CTERM sorting domain-containing protein [Burkholderiales bacterium]
MFHFRSTTAAVFGGALFTLSSLASAVTVAPGTEHGLLSGAIGVVLDASPVIDLKLDDTEATVGAIGELGYLARARTEYGVNHGYAQVVDGSAADGPAVGALSVWADKFVVSGPGGATGAFAAPVSVTISGTLGAADYADGGYALYSLTEAQAQAILNGGEEFVFDQFVYGLPTDPAYGTPVITDFRSSETSPGSDGFVLTGTVQGNYGEAFYLVSVLNLYAEQNGLVDASNSAVFGITAPVGASLATSSGTLYTAAVPEPGTYALVLAGLVFVATTAARRRSA